MADGLNRVMLLGNLGADPELRFTQSGQAVLNMRIATTESYLDKNKVKQERTDWHNVVLWGKRGEALGKILTKGSSLFVEGSLRTSSYEDRDGNKRYKTEIIANNIVLTGGRGRGGGAGDDYDASSFARDDSGGGDRGGGADRGAGGGRGYGSSATGGGNRGGSPPQQRGGGGGARPAPQQAPQQDAPPADDYSGGYGGGSDDDIPF